jgi:hypothetical protein
LLLEKHNDLRTSFGGKEKDLFGKLANQIRWRLSSTKTLLLWGLKARGLYRDFGRGISDRWMVCFSDT